MILPGVSICSLGEARGHNLTVDETLLRQLANEVARRGKVPVKLNHRGGLDSVIGWIQNARLMANKLIGDIEFLQSGKHYAFVRDLVRQFGGSIGLSPAFSGSGELLPDGSTAARCRELHSIDLVESPAANPTGLFEANFNGSSVEFSELRASSLLKLMELARQLPTVRYSPNADDERGRHGGTNIGHDVASGAIEGAGGAVLVDELLHGSGALVDRLAKIGRSFGAPIESGLLRKAAIGGLTGGLLTAGAGMVVSKLADKHRNKKQTLGIPRNAQQTTFATLTPQEERQRALYRVSAAKHRISDDELNRAASSYTKAGATGALAGGLIGSLKGKAKIGAGIGALAGIGSIKAIRAASVPDPLGQSSPEERAIEKAVPITAGIVAAIAAKKKLNQVASRAAENIGRGLANRTRLFT